MSRSPDSRRNGALIMARLVLLLGKFAYFLILAVFMGVAGYGCAIGVMIFGSIGIAKAMGEPISLSYGWIIALGVLCGVLRGALRYAEQYSNHYIAFKLLAILRDKIFGALRKLAPAKVDDKQKGGLIALVTSDIETLEVFYAHTLSPILICLITNSLVLLYVGLVSSWWLALAAFLAYLWMAIFLPILNSKKLKRSGVAYRAEFSSFSGYYLDSIKGVKDILLHHGQKKREAEVNRRSDRLLLETKKMKHHSSIAYSLAELSVSVAIAVSLILGIFLVQQGSLSLGKALMGVVAVFSSFGPVLAISALPSNLTQTFASGDRLINLLEEKPVVEEISGKADFSFEGVEVNDLHFAYPEGGNVLEGAELTLKMGEIVGVVGPSGCGKSTLCKLLLRFYDADSGSIKYNGLPIQEINTSSLLDNVTMVSQTTYLFDDTIEENLRIAKLDATEEEIVEACKKASIHDFIASLPSGYQTRVGTFLENVSAGEKQRIGLARAFLRGSRCILLDEPTSNVDSINEGIILKALLDQKKDHAILLISHRESTMACADRIYRFENGKTVEEAKQ